MGEAVEALLHGLTLSFNRPPSVALCSGQRRAGATKEVRGGRVVRSGIWEGVREAMQVLLHKLVSSVAVAARSTHNPQQHVALRKPTAANCFQPCQERNTCHALGPSIPCPHIPHLFTPARRCPAAWRACRRGPGPPRHTSESVESIDRGM